jgi:hypothetical protein
MIAVSLLVTGKNYGASRNQIVREQVEMKSFIARLNMSQPFHVD